MIKTVLTRNTLEKQIVVALKQLNAYAHSHDLRSTVAALNSNKVAFPRDDQAKHFFLFLCWLLYAHPEIEKDPHIKAFFDLANTMKIKNTADAEFIHALEQYITAHASTKKPARKR